MKVKMVDSLSIQPENPSQHRGFHPNIFVVGFGVVFYTCTAEAKLFYHAGAVHVWLSVLVCYRMLAKLRQQSSVSEDISDDIDSNISVGEFGDDPEIQEKVRSALNLDRLIMVARDPLR